MFTIDTSFAIVHMFAKNDIYTFHTLCALQANYILDIRLSVLNSNDYYLHLFTSSLYSYNVTILVTL